MLTAIDKLEVHVLVDNATDSLSSVPPYVETEFAYLRGHGMETMSGARLCGAHHGLSCLITAHRGAASRTVLFDAGPEADAFERNAHRLGVDLGAVESIVLSHGHWDHAGGMLRALELIRRGQPAAKIPYFAHPEMFRSRARLLPDGTMQPMEDVPSIEELARHGAAVISTREAATFLDDIFYVSGEIPRVSPFERGLPFHYQRSADGQRWELDPLIVDERYLAVQLAEKGLVIFTACSHAGVINVLEDARARFPGTPLYALVGGLHLSGPTEALIAPTIEALRDFGLTTIAAGHCTGWRAMAALANAFGDAVLTPTAVGKRFAF